MLGRVTTTTCPDCRHPVPRGRWCNRCGAALSAVPAPRPRRVPTTALAAGAVVLVGLGLGVAVANRDLPDDPTSGRDAAVVLAEDPPAPPAPTATPTPRSTPSPSGPTVRVLCSDLSERSVPTAQVGWPETGGLVELANGTCVVMGWEGTIAP